MRKALSALFSVHLLLFAFCCSLFQRAQARLEIRLPGLQGGHLRVQR